MSNIKTIKSKPVKPTKLVRNGKVVRFSSHSTKKILTFASTVKQNTKSL